MSDPKEKRLVPRQQVHLVSTIEADGKEIGCGVSRDASGAGLLLLTDVDIPKGTSVTLRVFVPREEDPRQLEASVIRSERIPPHEKIVWNYRVAVAFRNPPPDLQEFLQTLPSKRPPAP